MITPLARASICLAAGVTDMRKGMPVLAALQSFAHRVYVTTRVAKYLALQQETMRRIQSRFYVL